MKAPDHDALVRWLRTPDAYLIRPARVDEIETHISRVFLAADDAYKLKKPVKYDFLDYTSLEARRQACEDEARLNRRLSPDAYLGVVPVTEGGNGFQLGGSGKVIDWLVHMRRLPTQLTLDCLFRRGELRHEQIDRLAAVLIRFYRSLLPLSISAPEYRQRCEAHVRGNLRELLSVKHHLPRGVVERVHGFQLQRLLLQRELFEERVQGGRIVEAHGDLRPEHICFSDPIQIFDCIEFSADFRRMDIVDELAFLAAECDFLGATWVGPRLLETYQRETNDWPPPILIDFYKSYRACVRAKVAALRADQLHGEAQAAAAAEACSHLSLADNYARAWLRPLVLAVSGPAGTGKTTLATALATALGAELLRTDVVRKDIQCAGPAAADATDDTYSEHARQRVYDELLRRASAFHADSISVILDGTFSSRARQLKAIELARDPHTIFLAIDCHCRPEVARRRVERRLSLGADASEASPELHDIQRQTQENWPDHVPQISIDTEQPIERQVEQVFVALRGLMPT